MPFIIYILVFFNINVLCDNKENSKNIQFLNSLQQGKLKATNLPNLYYFNMSKSTGIAIKSETLFSIGMNQNVKKLK